MAGPASNGHAVATRPGELLRLATAGSVDDGKSTLIGRLLHDSKAILDDQMAHVIDLSERRGDGYVNLALLTDGLRAEREQGITIDVAYRYFGTGSHPPAAGGWAGSKLADGRGGRKFIIADTPGHEQYTRNMVTGASTADLSVVLVDARKGVLEQTRRHAYISSLLRIPHLVVCVNKMDLVEYDEAVFARIVDELSDWAARLDIGDVTFIPISALHGDNVVERSEQMPWYGGPPLLYHLEHVVIATDRNLSDLRFPVQWVIRSGGDQHHDYRGYAGQVAGGVLRPGAEVVVLPGGQRSRIASIDTFGKEIDAAFPAMSVAVRLEHDLDVSRGDMLAEPDDQPVVAREIDAMVCWMSQEPLAPGRRYAIKHTTRTARAAVDELEYRVDVNTLDHCETDQLELNAIGRVKLRTSAPLLVDRYRRNRATGSFILIDEASNDTVAAGMVVGASG